MKRRVLFVVSILILLSSGLSSSFVFFYLERESLQGLDGQLETLATSIAATQPTREVLEDFERIDNLLMDQLGERRVDRLIRIYSAHQGRLLYANQNAQLLALPMPRNQGSPYTTRVGESFLRVLEVPTPDFLLQVAVLMDPILARRKLWESTFFVFLLFSGGLTFLITALGTRSMLRPLESLTSTVQELTKSFDQSPESVRRTIHSLSVAAERWKQAPEAGEIGVLQQSVARFAELTASLLGVWEKETAILMHEIKTPLTVMRNQLDEIIRGSRPGGPEGLRPVQAEIDRLSRLTRDFVHWARLSTSPGQDRVHAVSVHDLVEEQLGSLEPPDRARVETSLDLSVRAFCDPEHLRQILRNLIENALKYSPPGGRIGIACKLNQLSVEDQGPGIPEGVRKRLGAPFNRSAESTGFGLGLAWVDALCRRYGWSFLSQVPAAGRHRVTVGFSDPASSFPPSPWDRAETEPPPSDGPETQR